MNNTIPGIDKTKDMFNTFRRKDFLKKTNALSFVCLCLFILDCSITGGGRYLSVFGITPRLLFGGLSVMFSTPSLIKNCRKYIKNPMNIFMGIFLIWLIICALRGWKTGNNQVVLLSDLKGFMYLFLIPISINCITDRKRIDNISNVMLLGAFVQAMMVFVINVLCSVDISYLHAMYYPVYEMGLGTVSIVSDSIFRIFMNSAPYLIVACVIAVFRQFQRERRGIFYSILTAFYLNAILLSYTRSLYGSAGITAVVVFVVAVMVYPKRIKETIKYAVVTALCTMLLISVQEIVFEANYLNFAVARTFNSEIKFSYTSTLLSKIREKNVVYPDSEEEKADTEEEQAQKGYLKQTEASDELRRITQSELIDLAKAKPILGNGLGACSITRNGPDEYFYLDVLARMGIIGMVLYLIPYMYMFWLIKKNQFVVVIVCLVLPFWIATAFNPWMNAAIGISCYSVAIAMASELGKVNMSTEK